MELAGKKLGLTPTTVGDIAQATQEGKSAENVNMFTQAMKALSSFFGPREGEFNTGTGVQPEGMHPNQQRKILEELMRQERQERAKKKELAPGISDLLYRGNTGLREINPDNFATPLAPSYNDLRNKYSGEGWGP